MTDRTLLTARTALVGALTAGALALAGAPAFAHVEVKSDTAQALAVDAVLQFNAEAESTTAGITSVRVVLPAGIDPADVSLVEAPAGWQLTAGEDGYTVAGPAIEPGEDLPYSVKVHQLPDAEDLAFKTLESYSDGRIDRWIELPTGGAEPDKPAPVLELKAAAPGATPLTAPSPSAAAPSPSAGSSAPSAPAGPSTASSAPVSPNAAPAQESAKKDDGSSAVPVVIAVVVVLAAAAGGALWWRRRTTSHNG
ncbi:DUF1775 domain-containing protein [Kitasatospora phosalacinea]|uniref:DUF1775 domain-containing protein n=1 Tax=Kitasatospora phosalacinea TaxID=2065 RepID=UPI00366617C7